ncbi:sigma-70 region 4 domain-containing protein [Nocardia rhamnosiphila]
MNDTTNLLQPSHPHESHDHTAQPASFTTAVHSSEVVRTSAHDSAQGGAQPKKQRPLRAWPVLLLALPAFVAIWSGWVGLGELTGFGPVHPLPGIADNFEVNTAITLPIGMETYASYALYVWLSGRIRSKKTRSYAMWSAFGSLALGAVGQVAYHLMTAAEITRAPAPVTVLVACLPVAVLGMGAALAHMIIREHHSAPEPRTDPDPAHRSAPKRTVAVREEWTETHTTGPTRASSPVMPELEIGDRSNGNEVVHYTAPETDDSSNLPAPVRTERIDQWETVAEAVCNADPAGRRDPSKVAEILRLRHEQNWPHARIADHVDVSSSTVTRTLTAARTYITETDR